MAVFRKLLKCMFWMLICVLLILPIGLIYQITNNEIKQYMPPDIPKLQETAIGGICQVQRTDIKEYVQLDGVFVSTKFFDIDLDYRQIQDIRWFVNVGEEIQEGQVLASGKKGDVVSPCTGIIKEMNTYSQNNSYIRVQMLTPVELSCKVDAELLSILKISEQLMTEAGEKVVLTYTSLQKNLDGTVNIRLAIDTDKYTYGEQLSGLQILTGRVFRGALIVNEDCVYQKGAAEDSPWYIRQVTETGEYIQEQIVEVGYWQNGLVSITGVEEGIYCDSGYKAIIED